MPIPKTWAGSSQKPVKIVRRAFGGISRRDGPVDKRHRGRETQKDFLNMATLYVWREESDRRGMKAQSRVRALLKHMVEEGTVSSFQETARGDSYDRLGVDFWVVLADRREVKIDATFGYVGMADKVARQDEAGVLAFMPNMHLSFEEDMRRLQKAIQEFLASSASHSGP